MSQQPCLPVGRRRKRHEENGNEDETDWENLNVSTMDAMEYLRLVSCQADRLPNVFEAANNDNDDDEPMQQEKSEAENQKQGDSTRAGGSAVSPRSKTTFFLQGSAAAAEYLVSHQTDLLNPPSAQHVPVAGKVWADRTLDAFHRLRLYLDQVRELQPTERKIPLPPMKDRAAWHVFCVGQQEAEGNVGAYYGDDDEDETDQKMAADHQQSKEEKNGDQQEGEEDPAWLQGVQQSAEGHYWPTTSLLLQMDQVMVRRVLAHLTHYLCDGWALTTARSAWLYGLAARWDKPVHRDDAVVLYKLLKRLTVLRAETTTAPKKDDDEPQLARINTLILIIGVYLEQGGGYTALFTPDAVKP